MIPRRDEAPETALHAAIAQLSKARSGDEKDVSALDRERVVRRLSEQIGALMLARAVARVSPSLSAEILQASRREHPTRK